VEAAGIEPASRGTSVYASTCVARLFWTAEVLRLRQSRSPEHYPTSRIALGLSGQVV